MSQNTVRPCPICRSPATETFPARYVTAAKCANQECGHVYAAQAVELQGVSEYPDPAEECRCFAERNRRLAYYFASRGVIRDHETVLDFGAGAGHIAMAVREHFPTASLLCIEPNSQAQDWLVANRLHVLNGLEGVATGVDVVLLVEVLEHLDDPLGVLKSVATLLNPTGRVFVTTPCGETRSGSRPTKAYETPLHVQFFTERSLRRAMESAGLGPVEFLTVNELYPRNRGPAYLVSRAKDVLRPIRDRIQGYHHLVTVVGHHL